jgi:hypothetical protein
MLVERVMMIGWRVLLGQLRVSVQILDELTHLGYISENRC